MFSLIELTVYVFHVSMCPMLNINESGTGMEDRARGASVLLDGPTSLRGNKDDKYTYFLLLCSSKRTNKQTNKQVYMSKYSFLKLSRQMPPLRVESSGCWLTPLLDIFTLCNISTRCKPQPPPQQTPPQSEILT